MTSADPGLPSPACLRASLAQAVTSRDRATSCFITPSSLISQVSIASSMMVEVRSGEEQTISHPESEEQVRILFSLILGSNNPPPANWELPPNIVFIL